MNNINSNSSEKKNQNLYTHILVYLSTHTRIHTQHISASICKYETYIYILCEHFDLAKAKRKRNQIQTAYEIILPILHRRKRREQKKKPKRKLANNQKNIKS